MSPHTVFSRVAAAVLLWTLLTGAQAWAAVNAPWSNLTYAPTGNTINAAYSPDNGATVYLVGDGGTILRKTGSTYTAMDSGTTAPLKAIHGRSASDIWAVGGDGATADNTVPERCVLLHFNGATWTRAASPPIPSTNQLIPMHGVWVSPTGQAYAVSQYSQAPIRYDTGTGVWAFEDITIDFPSFPGLQAFMLSGIYGFSDTDVYAVGSYGSVLHRGPSGWSLSRQFETEGGQGSPGITFNLLQAVWGPSASTVFISGNSGQVYMLDNTVQTPAWTKVNEGGFIFTAYDLAWMSGTSATDIWFVGSGGVLRHWNGTVNQLSVHDTPEGSWRTTILPTGAGTYLLAGEKGLLETFTAATTARTQLSTPPALKLNWKFAGLSQKLWLVPESISAATGLFTWNKGKFTPHPIPGVGDGYVMMYKMFAYNDVWLSTLNQDFSATHKRFNGASWSDWMPPGVFGNPSAMRAVAKNPAGQYALLENSNSAGLPCFADTQQGFMNCLDRMDPNSYTYRDIAAAADGSFHAVGEAGRIAVFRNNQWTVSTVGTDTLTGVAANGNTLVAVGENRVAYYTTNAATWQAVSGLTRVEPPNPNTPLFSFTGVSHTGNGQFWATLNSGAQYVDGGKGYLYSIQNGAATLVQGGYSSTLQGVYSATGQDVDFALGANGTILTTNRNFVVSPETCGTAAVPLLLLKN